MRLGIRTTTGDAEGEAIDTREVTCDESAVRAALPTFLGEITQVPPMYSALKRDGKPLYEYARAGQTVEREGRQVTIHALELLACALPGRDVWRHVQQGYVCADAGRRYRRSAGLRCAPRGAASRGCWVR